MNTKHLFAFLTVICLSLAISTAGAADPPAPPVRPAPALPARPVIRAQPFSILDFGANPDGKTKNTAAIAKAIDAVAAAGGGFIVFPKGTYLTGAIHLKSNIGLQIDEGATLLFSTDPADYPTVKTRWECVEINNYSPLIYAYQCHDIALIGKGTIDGNGATWWAWRKGPAGAAAQARMRAYANDDSKPEDRIFGDKMPGLPPALIQPYESEKIAIEGLTIKDSPFWTLHLLYSKDITLRDLKVGGNGPNTDGVDPDSCDRVLIENCTFTDGDDCVAIKSGRDKDGRRVNRPCENITVRNCTMLAGHGVSVGSETSGSIRHVLIENCSLTGLDAGVRMKSTRGRGGVVEDITYRNLILKNIKNDAISINLLYMVKAGTVLEPAPVSETTPIFRDILVENIQATGAATAAGIVGLPESPIQNVTLRNVQITAKKGLNAKDVKGLTIENLQITTDKNAPKTTYDNVTDLTIDGQKQ